MINQNQEAVEQAFQACAQGKLLIWASAAELGVPNPV